MKTLLEQAQGALRRRNPERALGLLLTAWRKKRAPALADLIDSVSEACAARLEPLPPRLAIDDFPTWRALCRQRNLQDFDRLVAVKLPSSSGRVLHMVEALDWREDPRASRFFAALMLNQALFRKGRDAERRANSQADIYELIAVRLAGSRDARAAEALASMSFVPRDFPWIKAREAEAFGRITPKLTASEQDLVQELSANFPAKRRRVPAGETKQLLDQVYARPDDLSARAVYADALLEAGDPRGEFISLQLSPTRDLRREAALLRKHEAKWAGPVARWFHPVGRVFEGGFFVGGKLTDEYRNSTHSGAVPIKRGLVEPSWRLVNTIEFPLSAEVEILSHPNLAGVRHVEFDHRALRKLADRTWPFTSLTVSYWFSEESPNVVPLLQRSEIFPQLQKLGFGSASPETVRPLLEWLPKAPVLSRLKQLSIELWHPQVAIWLPALKPSPLPELQIESGFGWKFMFTRDAAGAFSRLRCVWPVSRKKNLEATLFELLEDLPSSALTEFQLEESTLAKPPFRKRLKKALAKFKKLEIG